MGSRSLAWDEFLNSYEEVRAIVSKHSWLKDRKKQGHDQRILQWTACTGHFNVEQRKLWEQIDEMEPRSTKACWQKCGLQGHPKYRIELKIANQAARVRETNRQSVDKVALAYLSPDESKILFLPESQVDALSTNLVRAGLLMPTKSQDKVTIEVLSPNGETQQVEW